GERQDDSKRNPRHDPAERGVRDLHANRHGPDEHLRPSLRPHPKSSPHHRRFGRKRDHGEESSQRSGAVPGSDRVMKVYLDTSVFSALLDSREPSRQALTQAFWDSKDQYQMVTSEVA